MYLKLLMYSSQKGQEYVTDICASVLCLQVNTYHGWKKYNFIK